MNICKMLANAQHIKFCVNVSSRLVSVSIKTIGLATDFLLLLFFY